MKAGPSSAGHLADVTWLARAEKCATIRPGGRRALGQLEVATVWQSTNGGQRGGGRSCTLVADGDKKAGVIWQLREELTQERNGERDAQHHRLSEKSAIKAENRTHKKRLKQLQEEHSATVVQLQQLHGEAIEEDGSFPANPWSGARQRRRRGASCSRRTVQAASLKARQELTDRLERLAQLCETDES